MALTLDIPLSALKDSFGAATVARGEDYARSGRVIDVEMSSDQDGVEINALVRGNASRPYEVYVRADYGVGKVEVYGDCACPVGNDCKHVVAVLLAMREGGSVSSWSDRLGRALQALDADTPSGEAVPLGLMVEHKLTTVGLRGEATHAITLRPVQRGKRGTWIKQGIGWYDVRYAWRAGEGYEPEQWQVLRDMASAFGHNYGNQNPVLGDFGSLLLPLLHRAEAAGIEIVPGAGVGSFQLLPRSYAPVIDLQEVDGDIVVLVGLASAEDESLWIGDSSVAFLGKPAHGAVLIEEVEPPGKRVTRHFSFRLVELAAPVPEALQDLVAERAVIRVPAQDRSRFMSDFLPRLRRQLPTASSDDSVSLPDPVTPRLVAKVLWSPDHQVTLTWWWSYPFETGDRRVLIDSREGLREFREPAQERAALDAADLGRLGDVLKVSEGVPAAYESRRGDALLKFVEEVLPRLRGNGAIDIEEAGERGDYRPALGDPQISFDLTDPEATVATDWLDLAVTITVDEEGVPLGSVLSALTRGEKVIFAPSGRHVRADHPAFSDLAELISAAGDILDQPEGGVRVGRTDLALWGELESLGLVDAQAEQWVRSARALRDLDTLPDVAPIGLKTEMRAYQDAGLRWLAFMWRAGLGAILADDMGLGKTLQALALIAHARENGAAPFLVIAPTSVVGAWQQQAELHTPGLVVRTVTASTKKRGESIAAVAHEADVVVTSYTLFRLEAAQYAEQRWGGLVLDEAHNIKNHQGRTYQEVRKLDVPFRMALTGTPFENRLMELWALLSIAAPGLYPRPSKFAEIVVTPVEKHGDEVALERFRRRIRPFLLRRTKDLVAADLPPKQEQVLEVTLNAKHRRIYDTHLQRERQTVMGLIDDFDHQRIAIFRALTRLRQLSLDAALLDAAYDAVGSAKLDTLVEHLHELVGEGHRALVFSQFTSYLSRVRARLTREGIGYVYLDGRTRNRPQVIESFKSGDAPVFLISLKAGGVGLTLTEADYVFVLDPWWNPAVEAQAVDRAHCIGQERPVMVYRLVAEGTIEEKVMELKARKEALFGQVIDGDGLMSTEITAADVRGLFGD